MSCDELKDLYELYALGALEPGERRELEEHLERNCPACTAGVNRARNLAASLAFTAPVVDPPGALRRRVLAAIAPKPEKHPLLTWWNHAWATLAVLMLAAVLWYAYEYRQIEAGMALLNGRLAQAKTANAELAARNRLLVSALELINLPDSHQLVFGQTGPQPPRGRIWVHPQRGVLLLASNLAPAPAGKTYEMWIIPKGAAPIPAGLFNSDPQGAATHVWTQPVNLASAPTVAVTLEPEGGVPMPTSQPIIKAGL